MTIKRKSTGDLEEVKPSFTTSGFRWALIVLVVSMHPVGRALLAQMGFVLPDQAGEKRLQEEVQLVKADIAEARKEISGVKSDVGAVKADVAAVKSDVQGFSIRLSGFQLDMDRFKKQP